MWVTCDGNFRRRVYLCWLPYFSFRRTKFVNTKTSRQVIQLHVYLSTCLRYCVFTANTRKPIQHHVSSRSQGVEHHLHSGLPTCSNGQWRYQLPHESERSPR